MPPASKCCFMVALGHSTATLIRLLKQHYRITGARSAVFPLLQEFSFLFLLSSQTSETISWRFSKRQHAGYYRLTLISLGFSSQGIFGSFTTNQPIQPILPARRQDTASVSRRLC